MKSLHFLIAIILAGAVYAANELTTQTSASFNKNGSAYQIALSKQSDIAGNFAYDVVQNVTTNGAQVSLGAILPSGLIIIQNITTNSGHTVSYGTATNDLFGVINPGDHARFMASDGGTNLWLIATTNSCNVRVFAVSR